MCKCFKDAWKLSGGEVSFCPPGLPLLFHPRLFLADCLGTSAVPALLARRRLEDKLPITGGEEIETERGMFGWRVNSEGEGWFHRQGDISKGG